MSKPSPAPATDRGVLLDAWVATRAEIARLEAQAASLLAARAGLFHVEEASAPQDRDMARRSMIAEYAVAGRLGNATMVTAFADAELLTDSFPALHAALAAGSVTVSHVHQILAEAAPVRDGIRDGALPDEALAMFEAACLVIAEQDSPARTRIHARRIAAALTGETLAERHERANKDRNVRIRRLEDGMAELTVVLPEVYAVAILDRLTRIATQIAATTRTRHQQDAGLVFADPTGDAAIELDPETSCTVADLDPWDPVRETMERIESGTTWALDPDHEDHDPATDTCAAANLTPRQIADARPEYVAADGRTRQQIITDTLTDLLLTADPSDTCGTGLDAIHATVQVTIAASTLTGEDQHPAMLDGHGPLHPDIARHLASAATGWNRLFTSPTGMITTVDRYRPTKQMRRYLRARDQRCRFPGCHTPTARCEIDHTLDYAKGGKTELTNLENLCPAHHALKHPDLNDAIRWTARQHPNGDLTWTSPTGRTYTDRPPRRVTFT